jgi:hypothetical protein
MQVAATVPCIFFSLFPQTPPDKPRPEPHGGGGAHYHGNDNHDGEFRFVAHNNRVDNNTKIS